jgi:hypothetical protein
MAVIKLQYGASGQAITCTIPSLANNAQRASLAIANASGYLDVLVQLKVKSGASATSSTGFVNVYAYGTADGGADYSDGIGGTDAVVTLTNPPNVRYLGQIAVVANATTYVSALFSVASAFAGNVPDHWGIVVENKSGAALDATVGSAWYQGVYNQAV